MPGPHSVKRRFSSLISASSHPLPKTPFQLTALRAEGTLISEPRFSTPCKLPFFQRKTLDKGHFPFLVWEKSHLAGGRTSGLTKPFALRESTTLVAPYCAIPRDYLSDTPLACALWGFWCLNMANWARYPHFSERFPLGEPPQKWRCDTPSPKGVSQRYWRDTL